MVDQPDKKPVNDSPDEQQPGEIAGWHEPPVEEGSSRPVPVESWYTPENAVFADAETAADAGIPSAAAAPGPGSPSRAESELEGAWHTPLDAQLDALLSGAADTIIEVHETEPPKPRVVAAPSEDTQTQPEAARGVPPAADDAEQDQSQTRLIGINSQEPAVPAESTPMPDSTPSKPLPGLTPAEAAMLAEERAAQERAGVQSAPSAAQPAAQPAAQTDAPPPTQQIQVTPPAASQPQGATPQTAPAAPAQPSPFHEVERKVQVLRGQYNAGYMTREQLQNELRRLMILGEDGRWWMLGLESNRWYSYDGRDWKEGTPPGYQEAVRGSVLRTETGLQEVVLPDASQASEEGSLAAIEIDQGGLPLPRRVPQEDPGATLVSPSTPFLEPVRPSEARTQSHYRQVEPDAASMVTMPSQAAPQDAQAASSPFEAQQTMRSPSAQAAMDGVTAPHGIPVAPSRAAGPPPAGAHHPPPPSVEKPKHRLGEYPQPDYTAALGRDRRTTTRRIAYAVVTGVIGTMALTLVILLGMIGYYLYEVDRYAEAVDELRERTSDFETTLIMDANGTQLAEFSDPTTGPRREIPLDQISPWLIHATISTENETFYTDPGFSILAIVRAAYQNVQAGGTISGASTITQQLARALILETEFASERTTERKLVEVIVASEIKRKYDKNEVLEIYLNEIFYGNRAYGIEAAAQIYFKKSAGELNPAEAAFLAGLPQSPAQYDPVVNRQNAIQRMHTVLRLMAEANDTGCIYIEHTDATQWAVPNGGGLCIYAQEQADGSTLYYYQSPGMEAPQELTLEIALVETAPFDPPVNTFIHPHFVNYVWQQLEDTYGPQRIYSAGFRVTTTLDENIQKAAEDSVTANLADLQARGVDATNASVVVIRPSDGAVLAMVGSADYNNEDIDGQVNVAFTGQQPGSSIKPIVYLTAFEPSSEGKYLTPASVLWDIYTEFANPGGGPAYVPVNYDGLYHGPKSVREALGNSLNVPAIKTMDFIGLERFTEMAKRVGLRFPLGDPIERNAGLPTALGAVEVRLFDMVSAFGMLANNGRRVDPYGILRIEDSQGNEIYQANQNPEGLQVVKPEYAYLITSILSDSDARAEEFGYGWPMELQGGRPAAIKTGTSGTTDVRDVWTVGYTPQFVVGTWVGNSDNRPMYGISGYGGAAPIWNDVMEAAHAGTAPVQFSRPDGVIQAEVCRDSGTQVSADCVGGTVTELFASSAPPPPPEQNITRTLQVDAFSGKLVNEYCSDSVEDRTFIILTDQAAYNWINTTPEGNAWASDRGLEVPLLPPPTEYCDPNEPRPIVVIAFPPDNMPSVEGILPLRGSITMPNFDHFEIRYGIGHTPDFFSDPLVIDRTQRPEADSLLGQFDTRALENGPYTLRLVVIDTQGRSVTRDVRITINNPQQPQQQATPNSEFPTPTLAPSLTPPPG